MVDHAVISELQNRIAQYEDLDAYGKLYHLLFGPLYRFSYSLVKSREASEEIVSDVFIKIWQKRTQLGEIRNLKEYMYKITKNYSITYIVKSYKTSSVSMEDIDVETVTSLSNPEDFCITTELRFKIEEIINQLPPQCKVVFQLIKEDGLQYKEVASILDISVHTVRNHLATAVKRFYNALPSYTENTVFFKKAE